jgi:hypothetical protein
MENIIEIHGVSLWTRSILQGFTIKSNKKHEKNFTIAVSLLLLAPALASALVPAYGMVTEGVQAPGIILGNSRAQVINSYGNPSYCQSITLGDYAYCTYTIDETSSVSVRYTSPDGSNALNSPNDVVSSVSWTGLPEWQTVAGINTSIALSDPQAVINAYPNATVTYNNSRLFSVRDAQLGIQVVWNFIPDPTPSSYVSMTIFKPTDSQPAPAPIIRISSIVLKSSGNKITAKVSLVNDHGIAISGANVSGTWTYQNKTSIDQIAASNTNGVASFSVSKGKGLTFTITNVSKEGYAFDAANSITSAQWQ